MKDLKQIKKSYLKALEIMEILSDADNPKHEEVCKRMTLKKATQYRDFINECKNVGVNLLVREVN